MERIDKILKLVNENPVDFARKLGSTKELIYMIQKGKRNISKKLAYKIQDVYGIPFDYSYLGKGYLTIDNSLIINDMSYDDELSIVKSELEEYKNMVMKLQQQTIQDQKEIIRLTNQLHNKSPEMHQNIDANK